MLSCAGSLALELRCTSSLHMRLDRLRERVATPLHVASPSAMTVGSNSSCHLGERQQVKPFNCPSFYVHENYPPHSSNVGSCHHLKRSGPHFVKLHSHLAQTHKLHVRFGDLHTSFRPSYIENNSPPFSQNALNRSRTCKKTRESAQNGACRRPSAWPMDGSSVAVKLTLIHGCHAYV